MNIGTSLKTISKNQLCSFVGTGGYVELAETDVLSDGSIVTAAAMLPLLNSGNDKGEGILPPGYQKVEFLESSGTQYINTGVVTDGTYTIAARMQLFLGNKDVWGRRSNNGHEEGNALPHGNSLLNTYNETSVVINYVWRGRSRNAFDLKQTHDYVVTEGQKSLIVDGVSQAIAPQNLWSVKATNLDKLSHFLFWSNISPGITRLGKASASIYSFRMQDGAGNTALDLIPGLNVEGTPCMYDKVSRKCFYNAGTGHFRVGIATLQQARELQLPANTGNEVRVLNLSLPQEARTDFIAQNHLDYLASLNWIIDIQYRDGDIPAYYTKVDFLEADVNHENDTKYIDTQVVPQADTQLHVEAEMQTASNITTLFGVRNNSTSSSGMLFDLVMLGNSKRDARLDAYYIGPTVTLPETRFSIDYTDTQILLDGVQVSLRKQQTAELTTENTLCLMAMNYGSGTVNQWMRGKIYNFKLSSPEAPMLDLTPVINENGVPGMWDRVNKQFLANSGTGAFRVGIKTLNDVRMLDKALPAVPDGSTYSISVSLPVEASTDAPAQKALKDLAARGWSINVRYREEEIPAGYAKVSFLESSGTQYIELPEMFRIARDDNPKNGIKIRSMDYKLANDNYIFRINYNTTLFNNVYLYIGMRNKTYGTLSMGTSGHNHFAGPPYEAGKIYTAELNFLASNISKLDNVTRGNLWEAIVEVTSQSTTLMKNATCKLIDCVLSYGTAITRNLIPVINTDGVPGMWDTVSQEFFENVGTGQFRVGLASKEAVRNLYLEPDVPTGTTIDLSVPAGTTEEDTRILKENNPNYTFNIQYRS